MKRYFCDRCGKEVGCGKLNEISIPDKITGPGGHYTNKGIDVCKDCLNLIKVAVNEYNTEVTKSRFRFYKTLLPDLIDEV